MSYIKLFPIFKSDDDHDYCDWKNVEIWQSFTKEEPKRQGPAMYSSKDVLLNRIKYKYTCHYSNLVIRVICRFLTFISTTYDPKEIVQFKHQNQFNVNLIQSQFKYLSECLFTN